MLSRGAGHEGGHAVPEAEREPQPILPFLKPFYDAVIPWTWALVRVAVGWNLIVHGWGKILRGPVQQAAILSRDAANFGVEFAIFLTFIELVGGICIALGLFTRFFAAAIAIEMGYLTFVQYWGHGFAWTNRGYEYVLLSGLVSLAIALRGGGPWSLDRRIGREL